MDATIFQGQQKRVELLWVDVFIGQVCVDFIVGEETVLGSAGDELRKILVHQLHRKNLLLWVTFLHGTVSHVGVCGNLNHVIQFNNDCECRV